jgi:hypothetical protein
MQGRRWSDASLVWPNMIPQFATFTQTNATTKRRSLMGFGFVASFARRLIEAYNTWPQRIEESTNEQKTYSLIP